MAFGCATLQRSNGICPELGVLVCELLAMSANVPTDIRFSFKGLAVRGGEVGPHRDGFGIVFYHGKGLQEFRDVDASCNSPVARLVEDLPIRSKAVIAHVRQANAGEVNLENTHPFHRELFGRHFTFAHNGQLPGVKRLPLGRFKPVGTTDSEHAFCYLLDQLDLSRLPTVASVGRIFSRVAEKLSKLGVCNLVLTDGRAIYCWRTTKLVWITRRAPFGAARLQDADMTVDFAQVTTPNDVVTVVATDPLTDNEQWSEIPERQVSILIDGEWK